MAFVPVYIFILFFTIIIDYIAGIMIEKAPAEKRRLYLIMSIVANVGVLSFFKYYNFFSENFNALFHITHLPLSIPLLHIILPIGLSFHTFQAMSYTIEVYRGNQKAEHHLGIYALYVMFFPQLVAGPIERPQNMLHQFHETHHFSMENLKEGLKQILWGLFKKVVIADRLALVVNAVYKEPEKFNGAAITIACIFFAFQIYCDFSGYSDIAIGTARILGYRLMQNFNLPLHSKSISEFWRRWHISLSTWFYDYVFNPMVIKLRTWGRNATVIVGLLTTFALSGFWHGAGWTFILWGIFQGGAPVVFEYLTRNQRRELFGRLPLWLSNFLSHFLTLCYLIFTWILFRAYTMHKAANIMTHMWRGWGKAMSVSGIKNVFTSLGEGDTIVGSYNVLSGIALIIFLEILQNITKDNSIMEVVSNKPRFVRWGFYYFLMMAILVIGAFNNLEFIYFQF